MANRRFIDFPIASTSGDTDIILIWQDGLNKQTTKATLLSGLPEDLEDLNDVVISGLTNGQILRYNSTTGVWENTDQGNLDLNDLNDVTIVSPSNGQVLVYNSSTSKWENSSGGYVPYTGAVTTVNLGAQQLIAGQTTLTTNGSADTLTVNHTSGSGKAINVTKGGNGEGLYINKTSGSGNAATIVGTLEATTLVKTGGTSSQFLKADGSVDSTSYVTLNTAQTINGQKTFTAEINGTSASFTNSGSNRDLIIVHTSGSGIAVDISKFGDGEGLKIAKYSGSGNAVTVIGGNFEAPSIVKTGGTSSQFLKADGSVDSSTYGTGTVTSVGLSSATSGVTIGSTPVTTSGTITLAIATASGSQNGLLSSTDWTTFNNKQNALTNPVTGTGTTDYLPKFTGASTISNSNLINDASGNVGINTTTPVLTNFGVEFTVSGVLKTAEPEGIINIQGNRTTDLNIGGLNFFNSTNYIGAVKAVRSGANNSGALSFETVNAGTAGQRMIINPSGNVGVGVTPSSWGGNYVGLQISSTGAFASNGINGTVLGHNFYFDGTNDKYLTTGAASRVFQFLGGIRFDLVASGSAGNNITFNQAMTLNSSGRLLLGTTDDNGAKLQVNGGATFEGTCALADNELRIRGISDANHAIKNNATINGPLSYGYLGSGLGWTEGSSPSIALMNVRGNILIGTTSNGSSKLRIVGLPTSSAGLSSGDVWNNGGDLRIV